MNVMNKKGGENENRLITNVLLADDPAPFLFKEQHLSV